MVCTPMLQGQFHFEREILKTDWVCVHAYPEFLDTDIDLGYCLFFLYSKHFEKQTEKNEPIC